MIRVGAYALASGLAVLAALSYLLATSFILQGPRARDDVHRFQSSRDDRPAVVDHVGRSGAGESFVISLREPAGAPRVTEADPYAYGASLKPGDAVTLRYWKGRVAELLTPYGAIQTADDPRLIAEDSNPPSVLRTIAIGLAYSLVASGLVVAARRWTAPLLRR